MSDTPRLSLPLIEAAQAQKHVTHNEALVDLDTLVHLRLLDRDLGAPAGGESDGDAFLVAAPASGAWAGEEGNIAFMIDGGWRFHAPFDGLTAYIADEAALFLYVDGSWRDFGSLLSLQNLPVLGVGTEASPSQRLAVKSDEVIYSHDDVTPGNGNMVVTLNKSVEGGDAGHAYKVGWQTRALAGLFGSDEYAVKVSPDGASYRTALSISPSTGRVSFPSGTNWGREKLSAPRTYHVNAGSGSDGNNGLGEGTAFATIQRAVDEIAAIDLAGQSATIAVADGVYAENIVLKSVIGGPVYLIGNEAAPENVLLSPASGTAILAQDIVAPSFDIRGFKIEGSGITTGILCLASTIKFRNMDFGAIAPPASARHIYVERYGLVEGTGDYRISGGTGVHWQVGGKAYLLIFSRTISVTGSPHFTNRFALTLEQGLIRCPGNTFSGSATGIRFYVARRSYLSTDGAGSDYLPGSVAGTVTDDGRCD